jgi:hypothetical protein
MANPTAVVCCVVPSMIRAELCCHDFRSTPVARIRLHLVALAVALTAGCGATGVEGTTVVDEGCPVLPVESQCPQRPLPARVVVLNREGAEIARANTNDKGEFRIRLSAGEYVLQGQNLTGAPLPSATPVPVNVKDGRMQAVTIEFDSGVRAASTP